MTETMNHLLESRTGCLLEALSHEPTHIRDSETDAVQIALGRDSGNSRGNPDARNTTPAGAFTARNVSRG